MNPPRRNRAGLAALEAVLATGIVLPIVGFLFYVGTDACRKLTHLIEDLVGWPFL